MVSTKRTGVCYDMSDLISCVDYTIFRHRNVGESAPPRATSHASMAAVAIANGKAPLRGRVGQTRKGARNRKGDRLMISPSLGSSGRSMRGNTQKPLRLTADIIAFIWYCSQYQI